MLSFDSLTKHIISPSTTIKPFNIAWGEGNTRKVPKREARGPVKGIVS